MGCIASKQAVSVTPAFDYSGASRDDSSTAGASGGSSGILSKSLRRHRSDKKKNSDGGASAAAVASQLGDSGRASSNADSSSARLGNLHKYIEGEQVAAGWPAWLSAVAGEAIQGWVPLKADSYEKLEKIGQGTYSSVFRARDLDTGKIVALKKVRFDNFDPESVRFMAREIQILRRLDHPNVVKLEGLITSRFSCSMYLVFEYMEHDLAGLSSCPDINFTEPQIKCYMLQLLSGLEHCHSRGIMHRDIKGSNLLVNNEGILKIADFGLANFFNPGQRQPLTSRVVTLWYRPPELLLGSTDYGAAVDLWSVGCVFAELLLRKPILQGRTEVEQLHKIFKLCGSPPDDYWKKARLPHATIFRPQQPYENCLRETCNGFSETALSLIETFLSVEPYKRGSASTALSSDYFKTKPYACDPSTLPKYPPNKEIDAKSREDARRKRAAGRTRGYEATRRTTRTSKASQEPNGICRLPASVQDPDVNVTVKEVDGAKLSVPTGGGNSRACVDAQNVAINSRDSSNHGKNASLGDEMQKLEMNAREETNHMKNASQGDIPFSGPLHVRASSGFAWAKKRRDENSSLRLHSRSSSRSLLSGVLDPSSNLQGRNPTDSKRQPNGDVLQNCRVDSYDSARRSMLKKWSQLERPDSFDASEDYHSQELSAALYQREEMSSRQSIPGSQDQGDRVEFSGPLLCQSNKVDELLEKHERHIRQAVRRSWFQRGKKHGK